MIEENEIREVFASMKMELATYWSLFDQWSSNSQYGYTLDWFDNKEDAEKNTIAFYKQHANLIK